MDSFFTHGSLELKIVNWAGIAGAAFVVCTVLLAKFYRSHPISRVSIDLQAAIAFVDITRHMMILYPKGNDYVACSFVSFYALFSAHLNLLFNVAIAINLHYVFIKEKVPGNIWKYMIYYAPVIVSLILDLTPLAFNAYGRDELDTCYISKDSEYKHIVMWILVYITRIPGYIYCFTIFLLVAFKLKNTKSLSQKDAESQTLMEDSVQKPELRKLALRISLYPLSCFLCHVGKILFNIHSGIVVERSEFLRIWCLLGLSLNGILNFFTFILDPSFINAVFPKKRNTPEDQSHRQGNKNGDLVITDDTGLDLSKDFSSSHTALIESVTYPYYW